MYFWTPVVLMDSTKVNCRFYNKNSKPAHMKQTLSALKCTAKGSTEEAAMQKQPLILASLQFTLLMSVHLEQCQLSINWLNWSQWSFFGNGCSNADGKMGDQCSSVSQTRLSDACEGFHFFLIIHKKTLFNNYLFTSDVYCRKKII